MVHDTITLHTGIYSRVSVNFHEGKGGIDQALSYIMRSGRDTGYAGFSPSRCADVI